MKKRIFSALLATSMVISGAALADTKVSFDYDTLSVNLSSDDLGTAGSIATVSVIDNGEDIGFDNLPLYATVYLTDANGGISANIPLPSDFPGGYCYVYVDGASFSESASCMVINENDPVTASLVADIADCSDGEALYAIIKDNALSFGVDLSGTSDKVVSDACMVCMGEFISGEELTALAVSNALGKSMVYADIKNGGDLDEAMQNYAQTFGTTYEEYDAYSADVKKAFGDIFKNAPVGEKNLSEIYADSILLAQLRSCKSWGECRKLTEANADYIGIDIGSSSDFDDIKSQDRYLVYMDIYEAREDFKSIDDVADVFDASVKAVLKSQNKDKKPSSGGGGGGYGSSSGSAVVSGDYTANIPISDEIAPTQPQTAFSDIEGHFAQSAIEEMSQKGIINGYPDGTFCPDGYVTRSEIAKIISLALGLESDSDVHFDDVSADSWYFEYVSAMASKGFINGYDGKFNPESGLTRQDMAVIMANILKSFSNTDEVKSMTYIDSEDIADYAAESVAIVGTVGLMTGADSLFRPADGITRGEAALIVSRFLSLGQNR